MKPVCLQVTKKNKYISREIREKSEKMQQHQAIFHQVETTIYDVVGGVSMEEIRELQKQIKKDKGIRTSRIDWRTKTGIILWFCNNWDKISKFIDEYRAGPLKKPIKLIDDSFPENNNDKAAFDDTDAFFNTYQDSYDNSWCDNLDIFY